MDRERFARLVEEAVEEIPQPFQARLRGIEIVVEDDPSPEMLRDVGLDPRRDALFGLYEGTPLSERGDGDPFTLPDRIIIFYRPLVREFRTPGAIRREIRKTVVHEVAHFFGMDEDAIACEGY